MATTFMPAAKGSAERTHSARTITNRAAVLPLRPVLKVSAPPSTKRFVVFKLENIDFVEKFAEL